MYESIILHDYGGGQDVDVYIAKIRQIEGYGNSSIITFDNGDSCSYRESLQEIRAMIRELDADPLRRVRPAPSRIGAAESKHGRVTE